jgi:hypothetical protein
MRGSLRAKRSITAGVLSVEPSSTTQISMFSSSWLHRLFRHSARYASTL